MPLRAYNGDMDIVEQILSDVKAKIELYREQDEDHYDFWENHIKYVYIEAQHLAEKYGADLEVVKLGALLHDIALIEKVGTKADHHENGKQIAAELLEKYNYPIERKNHVLGCVLHHRSSKNAENIEELCVADADILAHFDNIPMLFNCIYILDDVRGCTEARNAIRAIFEKDYNDLSEKTKMDFTERYKIILDVVLGEGA